MDLTFRNVSFFTKDNKIAEYTPSAMSKLGETNFTEDTYLILMDSEDKNKFEWNLVFENCTFLNLY